MSKYEENGYTLLKGALNKSWVDRAQKTLSEIEPKVFLPFSDVPWGFGQLHSIPPFDEILTNQKLIDTCYELFNTYDYKVNHLLVSNKASFIGPEEMWHQEWPNMGTFSPGCSPEKDWKKFAQVFIAIDKMDVENGCLKIVPSSHKLGMVEHEDIVWNNMAHKQRAKHSEMKRATEKYGIMNVEMEPGDILVFNHRLLHGSTSNISDRDRKAVIMQVQSHNIEKDMNVFNQYNKHRTDFLVNTLQAKIDKETKTDKYADFNKGK
tara:strand:- start:40 stop:831 length:792 start_codon:yes stop_codon:yes gene_type:complete